MKNNVKQKKNKQKAFNRKIMMVKKTPQQLIPMNNQGLIKI